MEEMNEKCYAKGSSCPEPATGKVRLYSMRFCPFSKRVRLVLAAKNIPHEIVNINLRNKPEWYFEKNTSGRVPFFEDGDKTLTDSIIISEYLDNAFPNRKLYSKDPYSRARDQIMLDTFGKILSRISKALHNEIRENEFPSFWMNIKDPLTCFERELSNRQKIYFGGDQPGMLDLLIWPWFELIQTLYLMHSQLPTFPKWDYPLLSKWIENMYLDPVIKNSITDPKIYASFMETYLRGSPDFDYGL